MKICDLDNIYPYSEYIGKTVYLQRDTKLCISKGLPHLPYEFYIDGTASPSNNQHVVTYFEAYIYLPKKHPVKIIKISSAYSSNTPHHKTTERKMTERNSLTAVIELEITKDTAELYGLKSTTITAQYGWLKEGGMFPLRTFVSSHIRRAPWEPDSVPEKRYVGVMGDEMKKPEEE